ncbi:MAG: flavodoxin-dependent (E)-4-hydroxy-3-methylbut-2-enyl-diphosphate synthase [Clostridiales bacterium]|nr:flavodoxin-dependent (E)-4-hydroxy-3-methylbut-2-enyl-diphosphate synthase [Clostridiales bacterium]
MDSNSRINRKPTKKVRVGGIFIGGDAPVSVQSMTNTDPRDIEATVGQILKLQEAGCDLVRLAVPDMQAAEAFGAIRKRVGLPLAADIHFDYRLALECIKNGADKVRINPGNIGDAERVRKVVTAAKERDIPIRIGVNSGSVEKHILEKYGGVTPEGMVESALGHAAILEGLDFDKIILSIKASDVMTTIAAYRHCSEVSGYPLHVGVTEAGTIYRGTIKSSIGIGTLLAEGIGDTIRVSLTGDPVEEVRAGREILHSLGLLKGGIEFISCPTCGRTRIDLIGIANMVEEKLYESKAIAGKNIKVAVMGCAVNGPGEAREADIGIAGGDGEALLFMKGEIIRKIPQDRIVEELLNEIEKL